MEIHILESLPNGEPKTGKEIYDDLLRWEEQKGNDLLVSYVDIVSKADLLKSLKSITNNIKKDSIILQIDVHGLSDFSGISLKNEEIVEWHELKQLLNNIKLSRGELHLIMASCHGNYVGQLILHGNLPFTSFTGTEKKINPSQIIDDYHEIYKYILQEKNFLMGQYKIEELGIITSMVPKYSKELLKILIRDTIINFPNQNNLDSLADSLWRLFDLNVRTLINKPSKQLKRQDIVDAMEIYLKNLD